MPIILKMHPINLFELLKQVVMSWQVIAITIVLLIYIFIVLHISKNYHKPRVKKAKVKKAKAQPAAKSENEDDLPIHEDSNDELGLEEA